MTILFASDIHGSRGACEQVLSCFEKEQADRLVLLGDLLYHGPRNDLPADYEPKAVIRLLSEFPHRPLCVRGNCDAEIDQMVLPFPIGADYALLSLGERTCAFITHGHLFSLDNLPPLEAGDLLIHGHTHLPAAQKQGDIIYLNPGSCALPKGGNPPSYMVMRDGKFAIKTLGGEAMLEYHL